MKRILNYGLIAVSFFLVTSCATIFEGSKSRISFIDGFPANAKIYQNGICIGESPSKIKVDKHLLKDNSYLEIKKAGYETQKIQLNIKVRSGFLFTDLITGVIWIGFDFITGDIYKVIPNKITYNLKQDPTYIQTIKFDIGEKVLFTSGQLINQEGIVVALYPDKAVIKYKRTAYPLEKMKLKVDFIDEECSVPFEKIAKIK